MTSFTPVVVRLRVQHDTFLLSSSSLLLLFFFGGLHGTITQREKTEISKQNNLREYDRYLLSTQCIVLFFRVNFKRFAVP